MSRPAAISGDYTDLRFVKGRKVAIIHVEIPIEAAGAFVEAFGTPNPATGVPVALARIDPNAKEEPVAQPKAEKPKRAWGELSRAQQAGIACAEKGFWRFLYERGYTGVVDQETAAHAVRAICGVSSRSDIDGSPDSWKAWDRLNGDYRTWLRAPEVVG